MENIKETYHWDSHYPWAELISCVGFFLVFFVEEAVLFLMSLLDHNHTPKGPSASHLHTLTRHTDSCENVATAAASLDSPSKVPFVCKSSSMKRRSSAGVTHDATARHSNAGEIMPKSPHDHAGDDHANSAVNGFSVALVTNGKVADSTAFSPVTSDFDNAAKNGHCHEHAMHDETCTLTPGDSVGRDVHVTEMCNLDPSVLSEAKACASSCKQSFEVVPTTAFGTAEPECCEGPCDGLDEDPPIQIAFRPHAHSHGVRSITLLIALSFHSIIEGLAFGIQAEVESVAALFLSIVFHKCIVAFSVGLQLARTHAHNLKMVIFSILVLSIMSPVGTGVGIAVDLSDSQAKEIAIMIFEGLSVGTFLYVTFFEVFLHERDNEHPSLLKLAGSILGFVLIAAIRTMEHKHETSIAHDHGHATDGHDAH